MDKSYFEDNYPALHTASSFSMSETDEKYAEYATRYNTKKIEAQQLWRESKVDDASELNKALRKFPDRWNLTAEENLLVHTKLLGVPKDKIYEVLETVDLKDTGSKRASQFSHGMKERLGIAIALLNDPSLLILDEPTNGLDPVGIQELRELIATFPQKGMTVILSSHILSEVEQVVDEIGIINKGQLMFQGTPNRDEDLEAFFMEVIKGGARR